LAIALLLAASACTSTDTDKKGSGDATSTATGAASQTAPAGGNVTFTSAVPGVAADLDGGVYKGDPTRWLGFERGGQLLTYDAASLPGAGCDALATATDLKGEVAKSWEVSNGGHTITMHLRDITSPYGNKVTANDVKWTFDRTLALKDFASSLLTTIARYDPKNPVTVIDDNTFQLNILSPGSVDLAALTWYGLSIIDSTEAKKHATADDPWATAWLKDNSASFGPFTASGSDMVSTQQVLLHANPGYSLPRGNVSDLLLKAVPDAATRTQLLLSGQVDDARSLSYQDYKKLSGENGIDVKSCASANRVMLILNQKDKRFADPRVREAISLAVNRQALVDGAYFGFAKPALTGLSQNYGFKILPDNEYKLDPAKAKDLLSQAGYPDGFSFTITYSPTRPGPEAEQLAILLKSQLAAIGLKVDLKVIPGATQFSDAFQQSQYQGLLFLEPPAIADPYYSMVLYNAPGAFQNTFGYNNPEYTTLLEKMRTTSPGPARDQLISQVADFIAKDNPVIYLVDQEFVHAFSSKVSGYVNAPNGELHVVNMSVK